MSRGKLKSNLDAAVNNASLGVGINLREGRHLVRWENYLSKTALASVSDVFEIDKETVLAERLFTKDSQGPKWFGSKPVT